jgi:PAS domain S-box-containing protein
MSVLGGEQWFLRRVTPFRSLGRKLEGLILTFSDITELKRAEAERSQLAAIVDAILGQVLDGTITSWNKAAEKIYGYTAAEVLGRPLTEIVPPERAHEMSAVYARLLRGENVERFDSQRVTKAGAMIDVSVTVSPIRDDHGRISGFSSIVRDISAALRAAEQQARMAAIVESSDDGIISKTLEGIIMTWNRGAELIFGYTAQEVVGKSITVIIPEDRLHEEPVILSKIRRGEPIDHYETVRRRKNGELIDVSVTISPIRNARDEIIGASKIARDITGQKRAMIEIERSHKLLNDFVENATEGLHWVGADGTIIWANKAELNLLGYSRDEYIGHNISEFYVEENVINDILLRLKNNEELESYEARLRCKDGSIRHVIINSNVYCENGEFIHTRCFTRDITARKKMESELLEAKASLEQQVAQRTAHLNETVRSLEGVCYTMAHDLRSPLRAMEGFAEILLTEYSSKLDDEGKLFAQRIVAATVRMDLLIRDLLEFAKLAHIELPREPLDLGPVFRGIRRHLASEIAAKKGELVFPEVYPARVLSNRLLLEQIFTNLIGNALKFVAPGIKPHVRITVELHPPVLRVKIQDNGIGIAPEHQQRIFGLFQRLHTSERYPGTGVGLAIVQRGVERLGGRLGVNSNQTGGSCFWVDLPLAGK